MRLTYYLLHISFLAIFYLTGTTSLYAQMEAAQWYFGEQIGMHFNECKPEVFLAGEHDVQEGTAVISDSEGNLRFYTDGLRFWNSQHKIMPEGSLTPHWDIYNEYDGTTITQAALIVPQPGQTDRYFTFLTSPRSRDLSDGRFCYVIIGSNGLSAEELMVESGPVCLRDSLTERMTGVHHSNGSDFWVVVQEYPSADLLAYQVTGQGVKSQPVISPTGRAFNYVPNATNNTGYMKISPDGSKLAYVYSEDKADEIWYNNTIVVLDFDAATGQASNPTFIDLRVEQESFHGMEFSSDGSKLYVSSNKRILQYDLTKNDLATNEQIVYHFGERNPSVAGRRSLQLAPDGHIYFTNMGYLGAILYPNLLGSKVGLVPHFEFSRTPSSINVGLPNFVQSFLKNPIRYDCPVRLHTFRSCYLDSAYVSLLVDYPETIASVEWQAPAGSVARGLVLATPADPNMPFRVEASVKFTNGQDTTLSTTVNQRPTYRVPADTTLCPGDTLWVTPPVDKSYRWSYDRLLPEDVENSEGLIPVTEDGIYVILLEKEDCFNTEQTFRVRIPKHLPLVDLGGDRSLCSVTHSYVDLSIAEFENPYLYGVVSYQWQDGSTEPYFRVTQPGTYWLRVANRCSWRADTVRVDFEGNLKLDIGKNQYLCEGEQVVLDSRVENEFVQWSDGSTNRTLEVAKTGQYWVQVINGCGTFTDTVQVEVDSAVPLFLPDTLVSCSGESVRIQAGPWYRHYQWSTGEQDSVIEVSRPGYYEVRVENQCGEQRAGTVVVYSNPEIGFVPNVFTPNGDKSNDTFQLDRHLIGSYLQVHNRWGKVVFTSYNYRNEWDGHGLAAGVYFYTIRNACLPEPLRGQLTIQR